MESARLLDRFLNECLSIPPAEENGEFVRNTTLALYDGGL